MVKGRHELEHRATGGWCVVRLLLLLLDINRLLLLLLRLLLWGWRGRCLLRWVEDRQLRGLLELLWGLLRRNIGSRWQSWLHTGRCFVLLMRVGVGSVVSFSLRDADRRRRSRHRLGAPLRLWIVWPVGDSTGGSPGLAHKSR